MTLKETWSVARDQSRLGGSVPRLTRKTPLSPTSAARLQDRNASSVTRAQTPNNRVLWRLENNGLVICLRPWIFAAISSPIRFPLQVWRALFLWLPEFGAC